ncbi:hypothetical protein [Pseudomonas fluorescens]|uniref:hypothetical protein n=1 Tax=Pseudomonas fluorescens TaxID=294 RepID=UPI0012B7763A|nr:hypothetical protein [Pseudomonas fluorescens]
MTERHNSDLNIIDANKIESYDEIQSISPPTMLFKISAAEYVDIGIFCYKERSRTKAKKSVNNQSLIPTRCEALRNWTESAIERVQIKNLQPVTVGSKFERLTVFLDYADSALLKDPCEDAESYANALRSYTNHLRNTFSTERSASYLQLLQSEAIRSGSWFFPQTTTDFKNNLFLIRAPKHSKKQTTTPSEEEMQQSLSISSKIFNQLFDITMQFTKFPCQVNFDKDPTWIIPSNPWYVGSVEKKSKTWNYQAGRPLTQDETTDSVDTWRKTSIRTQKTIDRANSEQYTQLRYMLASFARDAFLALFCANSGLNEKQIIDLPEDLEIIKDTNNHLLCAIKNRSGGKKIYGTITHVFRPSLEKYIDLRKYLLRDKQHPKLFFRTCSTEDLTLNDLDEGALVKYYDKIDKTLQIDIPKLGYRRLRKFKSIWLRKHRGVKVSANSMGHTPRTSDTNYSEENKETAETEMTTFFLKLSESVSDRIVGITLKEFRSPEKDLATQAAHCTSLDHPMPEIQAVSAIVKCGNPRGCLFCENFRIHADEEDVRKICSQKYVTMETMSLTDSESHFNEVHGETIARIDLYLDHISKLSKSKELMVKRIHHDVFSNENLTPYWSKMMNFFISSGMI